MSRHSTTAGIDIGDKHSHLYLLDTESGEMIEERARCARAPRRSRGTSREVTGCR